MTDEKSLLQQAEKAMQDAVRRVIEEARRTHGTVVVWEQGAVREIPADQLPPALDQATTDAGPTN